MRVLYAFGPNETEERLEFERGPLCAQVIRNFHDALRRKRKYEEHGEAAAALLEEVWELWLAETGDLPEDIL